jgi:hypothetical protein
MGRSNIAKDRFRADCFITFAMAPNMRPWGRYRKPQLFTGTSKNCAPVSPA